MKPQTFLITGSPIHRIREHGSWWVDAPSDGFTAKAREMTVPSEDVAMSKRPQKPSDAWKRRDDR